MRNPGSDHRKGPLKGPLARDEAESIATEAFAHIAADPERIERFLALTGLDPSQLREASASPMFLPAVLDHLAGHEPDLLAFADATGQDPARIAAARELLAGNQRYDEP